MSLVGFFSKARLAAQPGRARLLPFGIERNDIYCAIQVNGFARICVFGQADRPGRCQIQHVRIVDPDVLVAGKGDDNTLDLNDMDYVAICMNREIRQQTALGGNDAFTVAFPLAYNVLLSPEHVMDYVAAAGISTAPSAAPSPP